MKLPIERHKVEMDRNVLNWNRKPLLRSAYDGFYRKMIGYIRPDISGKVVEIGSGIGNFKAVYPNCIATDIFKSEWVDQVESAYKLSFANDSVSHIILFDVLHHLKFLGSAFNEFKRVLKKGGRVIICDPYISLLGLIVYGPFHHEPINMFKDIDWLCPNGINPDAEYYAAQGNAARVFGRQNSKFRELINLDWNIVAFKKSSALAYVLSGGFSRPSLYPQVFLPIVKVIERFLDLFPSIFATRTIIVLEKK